MKKNNIKKRDVPFKLVEYSPIHITAKENKNTLEYKAKVDNAVMRTLKLHSVSHLVLQTPKGPLTLVLPFEGLAKDYNYHLDSIPLDKATNKALLEVFNGILYEII